ncbi:hypothetical protein FE257_000989 [Aspergillus nanangensis]|uniref:Suppressor protein SRP40 n=1 Tax=Aspergillus nanangensis TaxID=2582783 RepID=A0AAD4GX41_ASPNN|nr:hypothetical protein FE257_000989 [Aspergillus nanangensis]
MSTSPETSKRLHITPFAPDLLSAILPASVQSSATEISFHNIPTFPEKNFGYVTLPAMEADKVKKKLNGSILKGRKFKVESARPQKRQRETNDAENVTLDHKPPSDKKQKKEKKNKDGYSILEGYELPPERQVKRGWTESTGALQERRKGEKKRKEKPEKTKKSQAKSKYTEKSECLFRTNLPANRSSGDEEKSSKKKKTKKPLQESVVHEFSKTISQPSFLRSGNDGTEPTSTYEEGKGWLDASGKVKEQPSNRTMSDQHHPGKVAGAKEKRKPISLDVKDKRQGPKESKVKEASKETGTSDESEDWTSSSGSSSDDTETDSESEDDNDASSSSSEESEVVSSEEEEQPTKSASANGKISNDIASVPEGDSNPDEAPPTTEKPSNQQIHPLEALFKRPAADAIDTKVDSAANAPFSFFGQEDIESEEEPTKELIEPHTPFTKKDLQARGQRSAAPTPDTGFVGRKVNWTDSDQDQSMDEDEPYANTPVPKPSSAAMGETDFTKWFWENRGDNNRAWKKRRRDVAKEQRQRDNRSKGMKGKS